MTPAPSHHSHSHTNGTGGGKWVATSKPAAAAGAAAAPVVPATTPSTTKSASAFSSTPVGESAVKDYYFDSYSHFGIHEEMLKDSVRTRAYMDAIMQNKQQFKDKVVLDIGAGTGILCMFAAKAGARKVIGIECASIYHQAVEIVKENHLDHIITMVQSKVEDITQLPDGIEHVDIIVSEWMGYALLYESMMDTVLYARDRWLVKDGSGLILPDRSTIHVAALEDRDYRENKINFWSNVYGYSMKTIQKLAVQEPLVDIAESRQIISNSCKILDVDLYTVTKEQLDFSSDFSLQVSRNDYLHGLILWFDVEFERMKHRVHLTTSPHARSTHWKQVIYYIEEPQAVSFNDNIQGHITCQRNARNPRDLDWTIQLRVKSEMFPFEMPTKEYKLR